MSTLDPYKRIKALREYKRMTQKEFGESLSVPQSYISKLEHGAGEISFRLLVNAVTRFQVNPYWLLCISGVDAVPMFQEGDTVVPVAEYERVKIQLADFLMKNNPL